MTPLLPWPFQKTPEVRPLVQCEVRGSRFRLDYKVTYPGKWEPKSLGLNTPANHYRAWTLWEGEVLECFLQGRNPGDNFTKPYLELQVSPFHERLALILFSPRNPAMTPLSLEFQEGSDRSAEEWKGFIEVVLPPEIQGEQYYGHITLGTHHAAPKQNFWGLKGYVETSLKGPLDFHRPDLFVPLHLVKTRS